MLLLLLIYVVLRALWKKDVYLISTLVNKSLYYYYYNTLCSRRPIDTVITRYHFVAPDWHSGNALSSRRPLGTVVTRSPLVDRLAQW